MKNENINLSYRKATIHDLRAIISLLLQEDELEQNREPLDLKIDQRYLSAFHNINADPHQYLMVVESSLEIVGTCHLTLIHSLTFIGSTRLQIEAVRISEKYRGEKNGEWMINAAIEYAKSQGASIIQLTTNIKRVRAKKFYEKLGFKATHTGMKLYL